MGDLSRSIVVTSTRTLLFVSLAVSEDGTDPSLKIDYPGNRSDRRGGPPRWTSSPAGGSRVAESLQAAGRTDLSYLG